MVREGRVLISVATDPDFGSNYYVTAYEVGAQVSSSHNGTGIPVSFGHGFAEFDKFIVLSELPATTKMRTVTSVADDQVNCAAVTVADGDVLINLGPDSETSAGSPDYDGSGALGNGLLIYSDMDFANAYNESTVQTDSNGRYRYFYNNIARWELVRTSAGVPIALYMDGGDSGVGGPASSTDNAVARFDGMTGQAVQSSSVIIADAVGGFSDVTGIRDLTLSRDLVVGDDLTVTDDMTVGGTSALADVTVSTTLDVTGNATVGGTLGVTGNLTASAALSAGTTLAVGTNATVSGTLGVTGTTTLSAHLMRSVAASVTAAASPNNTQAGGTVLSKDVNNVAVCATAGNSVVMPAAAAGMMVSVFNNGAASCAIWPAVGDNLSLGLNVQNTLANGSNVTYIAFDTTNWEVI